MQPRNRPSWIRIVILGVLLVVGLTVVQLGLAQAPGAPSATDGGETDLFGVRILDAGTLDLADLGSAHVAPADQGGVVAHVTSEQLERLRAKGIAFEQLGRVAVFSGQGSAAHFRQGRSFNGNMKDGSRVLPFEQPPEELN